MVVAAEDAPQMALQLQHDEGLVLPSWHASERAQVRLAQSLYQLRELQRVASVLQPCTSSMAKFIRRYALYLHGEKKLEESKRESPGTRVPMRRRVSGIVLRTRLIRSSDIALDRTYT